jgi:thiol-disulfide isomerase/thioredoxin
MNLVDVLAKYIRPYYYYIIALVMLILFVIISYYAYTQFYNQNKNKFKDVANADRRGKDAVIMFFHADWCPHCKKADPEWKTFMSQNDGKSVNGYVVKCNDINCTDDTNSKVTQLINEYNIKSYPTVKMIKDDQVIEFDSKITNTALNSFIETMLNQ